MPVVVSLPDRENLLSGTRASLLWNLRLEPSNALLSFVVDWWLGSGDAFGSARVWYFSPKVPNIFLCLKNVRFFHRTD